MSRPNYPNCEMTPGAIMGKGTHLKEQEYNEIKHELNELKDLGLTSSLCRTIRDISYRYKRSDSMVRNINRSKNYADYLKKHNPRKYKRLLGVEVVRPEASWNVAFSGEKEDIHEKLDKIIDILNAMSYLITK